VLIQPAEPIVVRVVEPAVESTTVADILIGALGLTGALLLAALALGAILGGILIGVKRFRERYNLEPIPDSEALRVTPDVVGRTTGSSA
jgi:hypothetical protein